MIEVPEQVPVEDFDIKRPKSIQARFNDASEWKKYIDSELYYTRNEIQKKRAAWSKREVVQAYLDLYQARLNFYNNYFRRSQEEPDIA